MSNYTHSSMFIALRCTDEMQNFAIYEKVLTALYGNLAWICKRNVKQTPTIMPIRFAMRSRTSVYLFMICFHGTYVAG